MNKKRKIGAFLILLGIGIPLVFFFFQENDQIFTIRTAKSFSRKLNAEEIKTLEKIASYKGLKWVAEGQVLVPTELIPFNKATRKANGRWEEVKPNETFEQYATRNIENKEAFRELNIDTLLKDIESIYGKDHFEREEWDIKEIKSRDIKYRHILGLGVFIIFMGLSFLVFSFFPKK